MDDAAARFRRELEERTGESVVEIAMANLEEGGAVTDSSWGLLVLTDASLRFSRPPSRHWITSLIRPRGGEVDEASLEDIVMPLAGLSLDLPRPGFIARLLGPGYRRVEASWKDGEETRKAVFAVDPRAPLLERLRSLSR